MKNCKNCGHLKGTMCLAAGITYSVERQYNRACDKNFSAWTPKLTLKDRLLANLRVLGFDVGEDE